jgi:hypothetical protein
MSARHVALFRGEGMEAWSLAYLALKPKFLLYRKPLFWFFCISWH